MTLQGLPRILHNAQVFYGRDPGRPPGIKNSDWKKALLIDGFDWHDLRHTIESRLLLTRLWCRVLQPKQPLHQFSFGQVSVGL